MELYQAYRPRTATPLAARELAPPYPLRPYVRCFWCGTPHGAKAATLVVPDTCADLIFRIDGAGRATAYFCGVDDAAFLAAPSGGAETFGVRFYAWGAAAFAARDLYGTKNKNCPAEEFFPALVKGLAPRLSEPATLEARAGLASAFLLETLRPSRCDGLVREAVGELLQNCGVLRTGALARELHVSLRQLERVFAAQTGLTPKAAAELIRYQCLWQELLRTPGLNMQTAVEKYGFADQAHLLNSFKRYHTLTPRQALALAREKAP